MRSLRSRSFSRSFTPEPTVKRQQKTADQVNVDVARIILADPERYPGIMQECAARWVEQAQPTVAKSATVQRRPKQGDLFAEVA